MIKFTSKNTYFLEQAVGLGWTFLNDFGEISIGPKRYTHSMLRSTLWQVGERMAISTLADMPAQHGHTNKLIHIVWLHSTPYFEYQNVSSHFFTCKLMLSPLIYQCGCLKLVRSTLLQWGKCSSVHDALPCIRRSVFFFSHNCPSCPCQHYKQTTQKETPISCCRKGNMLSRKPPRWPTLTSWLFPVWGCGYLCLILRILDSSIVCVPYSVFKIEVFNALQMRLGPSKYTSLKTTLQNATPNWN